MTNMQPFTRPCYVPGAALDRKERARTQEMAEHFRNVLMDTGFAPSDVALAFVQAGLTLARELQTQDPAIAAQVNELVKNPANARAE